MEPPRGIEPRSRDYETRASPAMLRGRCLQLWKARKGSNLHTVVQSHVPCRLSDAPSEVVWRKRQDSNLHGRKPTRIATGPLTIRVTLPPWRRARDSNPERFDPLPVFETGSSSSRMPSADPQVDSGGRPGTRTRTGFLSRAPQTRAVANYARRPLVLQPVNPAQRVVARPGGFEPPYPGS
jgi:hypothetical protein